MLVKCGPPGKTWTVLVYANGNNDMEPEIYRGIQAFGHKPAADSTRVVVQLGRAPQRLVRTFRGHAGTPDGEQWDGVRRYVACQTGLEQVAALGRANMADPAALADFLCWGAANYPADYVMAILSGHGAGFIGLLTDYTQPYPMLMSVKGLTAALRQFRRKTGQRCAILVVDACYMNMIEIWYELAFTPTRPVRFLLTPLGEASLECLPYDVLVEALGVAAGRGYGVRRSLAAAVAAVNGTDKTSGDVLAVNLAADNFALLKAAVDELAGFIASSGVRLEAVLGADYRRSSHYPLANLLHFSRRLAASCPDCRSPYSALEGALGRIIPVPPYAARPKLASLDASIFMPVTPGLYRCFAADYEHLLFAAGNRWPQILRDDGSADREAVSRPKRGGTTLPPPVAMSPESLVYSLQERSPDLTAEQARQKLRKLGWRI